MSRYKFNSQLKDDGYAGRRSGNVIAPRSEIVTVWVGWRNLALATSGNLKLILKFCKELSVIFIPTQNDFYITSKKHRF